MRYIEGMASTFNVEKCVAYLCHIGCEIEDEQVARWTDAEQVHRYLRNERKPKRYGAEMRCRRGHEWTGAFHQPARSKKQKAANEAAKTCPDCGELRSSWSSIWLEARDGTVIDRRPQAERWKPLPSF